MTKKQQIEKLKRVISIKVGMINELHELIGAEHERAETFKMEADVWKDKAERLGKEVQKLQRQLTPILQGGKEAQEDPLGEIKEMIRQLTTDVRMLKGMVECMAIEVGMIKGLLLREAEGRPLAGATDTAVTASSTDPDRIPEPEREAEG